MNLNNKKNDLYGDTKIIQYRQMPHGQQRTECEEFWKENFRGAHNIRI